MDPIQMITNLNNWLLGIFAAIGVTVVIYGIYQLVTTWINHDMTQRLNAILTIVGGVVLISIGIVLGTITGTGVQAPPTQTP